MTSIYGPCSILKFKHYFLLDLYRLPFSVRFDLKATRMYACHKKLLFIIRNKYRFSNSYQIIKLTIRAYVREIKACYCFDSL